MSEFFVMFCLFCSLLHDCQFIHAAKNKKNTNESKKKEPDVGPAEDYYRSLKHIEVGIHVIGVIGLDEKTKEIVSGGIEQEVEMIFQHIKTILDKHGTSFKRAISLKDSFLITSHFIKHDFLKLPPVGTFKFYVKEHSYHPLIEEILKKHVEPPLPGRSLIVTENLPKNVRVECEFVAFTKKLDISMTGAP